MSISVQQMADRVAELLQARLGVKGDGLSAKLKRGGRFLPKRVLGAAQFLALAAEQVQIPKLYAQLDPERTAKAYDICIRHLKPLGAGARRRAWLWNSMVTLVAIVFVTAVLVLGVLAWRGLI